MRATLASAAVLLLATTVAGSAADLAPVYSKTPAAAVWSWTGFYIGGNIGGGVGSSQLDDTSGAIGGSSTSTRGFATGGAQIGYNYQFGAGLVGIEADLNGNAGLKNSAILDAINRPFTVNADSDVSGTIRGRAGLVFNNALFYVTGGAAWADVKQTGVKVDFATGLPTSFGGKFITANGNNTVWGGVIGVGAEFAVARNWTVGAEVLHTVYQDINTNVLFGSVSECGNTGLATTNCLFNHHLSTDVARLRLNYRFDGSPAPDLAAAPMYRKAPVAAAVWNWTGFYIGGNFGGGTASSQIDDAACTFFCSSSTPTRGFATAGAQIGYNYQFGAGVVGIEADVNRNSGLKNSAILTPIDFDTALEVSARAHVSGTIRGRAGVVLDNALVYVTGGAAWADVRQTGVGVDPATGVPVSPAITANSSNTVWGGVIGAGVEFAVAPNWTVGAEVLHTVYQDVNANLRNGGPAACTDPGPLTGLNASSCFINHHLSTDVARLRFNYKLDGGVAPELAAAPMYTKAPAALWNWTGFYIGGNLGGGVASSQLKDAASFFDASSTPTTGFATGGAQIGYNYQFGAGLIGIEADVNGNAALKNSALLGADDSPGLLVSAHSDVSGTIRGRAGLVVNNALVYATGGAAWANIKQTGVGVDTTTAGVPVSPAITANSSNTVWGGVIGAGVEFAVARNWTVGAEVLHTVYQDVNANLLQGGTSACGSTGLEASSCFINHHLSTDVARLRFNYKIN